MVNVPPPLSFQRFPLDSVLGSVAKVRVLRVLLAHSGVLSVSRIAADTRLTPQGTRLALNSLEQANAVLAIGSGRTRLYRAHQRNPLVVALSLLYTQERTAFDNLLSQIEQATSVDGIDAVWLFGSVARSTDTTDSDIDIALLLGSDKEAERDAIGVLVTLRLSELFDSRPSVMTLTREDIASLRASKAPLWSSLVHDGWAVRGMRPEDVKHKQGRRHA